METVHACVWSIPKPKILLLCVHICIAVHRLSMLQVACTALGVNHCLLKGRTFDMCIVDEAGQMTLPVALGPILHSKYGAVISCLFELSCTESPKTCSMFRLVIASFIHSFMHMFTRSITLSFFHSLVIASLVHCTIVFPYHQVYTVLRGSQHEVLQSVNQQGHLTCLCVNLA